METFLIIIFGGSTVSSIGVIFYIFLQSFTEQSKVFLKKFYRFLYSVSFSIFVYIVSSFIFSLFDIQLGFTDLTAAGITSSVLIYAGTSFLTKDTDLTV